MRKLLSVLFSAALALSMLPATAFAMPESAQPADDALAAQETPALNENGNVAEGTWGTCPWEISADGTLTVHPGVGENASTKYTVHHSWDTSHDYDYEIIVFPWYEHASKVTGVVFTEEDGQKVAAPEDCSGLFEGLSGVTSVELSGLDTSRTTDMSCMFGGGNPNYHMVSSNLLPDGGPISICGSGCVDLEYLDVSGLNTSNVTNMWGMFSGLRSLKSLDLSSLDTSNVTDMTYMFCGSYSLKDLDLASFDTVNVKSMNGMFQACAALESINLSGFDTSGVTNMLQMFEFCGNLKSLDLSSFDTSNVTHMNNMFLACMSLGALDLSNFDTLRVTEMGGMFSRCRALKTLSLSNFDTSKVTSMWDMFANCDSLVSVDLSSFDTANVTSMARMFENCPSLTALDLSGFNTSNLSEGDGYLSGTADMFSGCDSLGVIILGAKVSKLGTLPSTDSYGLAQWKSQATGEWYTAAQVIDGRLGIADSYTRGVQYKMLDLSVESYSPGASGGVTIRFDGPFELFTKLVINGVEVPKDKYTARSGSTVVELSDSYLSGLSTGEQEVTALYSNGGSATTSFEIAEATDPDPAPSPKPDDPKPVDPKPDTPGTDDPGTTDKPSTDKPGTDGPGTADPKPDDADKPGVTDPEPVATQVMYRAYNPNSGEHFYTAHYAEIESIVAAGWLYEGEAWTAPVTSATPVYRLYSGTDHHYTTSTVERDHLISVGWSDEGIGWYSDDNQGMGLHRLFNPNVDPSAPINNSGSHHYTTSDVERDHLVSIGWRYEDFGWYGVK